MTTAPSPPAAGPAAPAAAASRPRLVGVDAARGVALLGMMAVHALYAFGADGDPTVAYSVSTGRSAAVFAVLAGVGIAFTTGRARVGADRAVPTAAGLTARAAVIGLVGLALGYTDAEIAAVILPYYAVLFVLAVPLVFLGTRTLIGLGVLAAFGMPVLGHLVRDGLAPPRLTNPSFGYLVTDPLGLLVELTLTGYYPALAWLAYLCVGIAVGRLTLSSARVAAGLLGAGAAVAVAAWAGSALLLGPLGGRARIEAAGTGALDVPVAEMLAFGGEGVTPTTSWWWLAVHAPHTSTPPDLLHTAGVAVALLGGLLLLGHVRGPAHRAVTVLLGPLAAAGAMTLTLYAAHVVFLNSPLDVFSAVGGYVFQVVVALLFALAWRQAVGRGPLDFLAGWAARRAQRAAQPRAPVHRGSHRLLTGSRR
ncbi:heparan-alpha-glucosaminide N-acetyltransferase domain-containing protein [Pseudonocardia sp.]|uniref:heparan-alpha-glucosaminide N-acetyltransferase domain-containing protein n=1 Tax=Pseudonocardia sp. TaxID=60912 RepID=UPI002616C6FD|nr:heparan-alpha-glucosaminide N-acetyltransferase domain-containing protein [Pseudonocardia sp.]